MSQLHLQKDKFLHPAKVENKNIVLRKNEIKTE